MCLLANNKYAGEINAICQCSYCKDHKAGDAWDGIAHGAGGQKSRTLFIYRLTFICSCFSISDNSPTIVMDLCTYSERDLRWRA